MQLDGEGRKRLAGCSEQPHVHLPISVPEGKMSKARADGGDNEEVHDIVAVTQINGIESEGAEEDNTALLKAHIFACEGGETGERADKSPEHCSRWESDTAEFERSNRLECGTHM